MTGVPRGPFTGRIPPARRIGAARGALLARQALGVAFVALLAGALTLAVLQYRKVFTPVARVTLYTAQTGLQLDPGAEVKLRGVPVGEVRAVRSDGGRARIDLALDPALIDRIPADVTARLLPKTLFGERYVALVPPADNGPPAGVGTPGPLRSGPPRPGSPRTGPLGPGSLRPGAVIGQDRSRTGVELQRVLDEALPLLRSIRPDRLAAVLGALATALEGRGERLGADLDRLERVLGELNREMPTITEDVRRLTAVLDGYHDAWPDLADVLRDVSVTARTVADQRAQLAAFLAATTEAGDVTAGFLDRHGDQLIRLGRVSRPVLELLAAYAPEYPCLVRGLVALQPRVEEVFRDGRMHITLEVTRDNGKYQPGRDEPVYGGSGGPACHGLPDPPIPAPHVTVDDGYDHGGARPRPSKLPVGPPTGPGADGAPPAGAATAGPGAEMGYAGTPAERDLIRPIVGAATGELPVAVPDIAVLLWGPLLRGGVVHLP